MIRIISTSLLVSAACVSALVVGPQPATAGKRLPDPSGKYAVARTAFDWTDESRSETLSKVGAAHREIMVYVWYPTDKGNNNTNAAYLPGVEIIAKSSANQSMKEFWGDSWPLVVSGQIAIETAEKAPIVGGKERFPLLVFSPGLGIPSTAYTALIQEVVSRGYIVASIEPTYEVPAVAFPDGRVLPFLDEATGRHQPVPPDETREKFLKRMHTFDEPHFDRWAADIRFTIDQVATFNAAGSNRAPFSGRVDLRNIAAWGHSFGGRAAPRACQLDPRIKACLNADGLGSDGPIFTYPGAALPSQPVLWMEVFHEPPSDEQLASAGISRNDWNKNHQVQLVVDEQQLKQCPGGSYHVSINLPGIDHFSFTDKPFIDSDKKEDVDDAVRALRAIEAYTIAFFDRYLKQEEQKLLNPSVARPNGISLEKFGSPQSTLDVGPV